MRKEDMVDRTRRFALRVIRLVSSLPNERTADIIARQVLRSGTAIGANYREATRAATKKHFASILSIALREADETLYWLELLRDAKLIRTHLLRDLVDECNQFVAMLAASVKTAANRGKTQK